MDVLEALSVRHSTRAFLDLEVSNEKVQRILRYAGCSPSGANTQPWRVAVVSGRMKKSIETQIEEAYRAGDKANADYQYYPIKWTDPYKARRFACGMQLYEAVDIDRDDKQRRREQWIANYRAFGAPVALYVFIESHLEAGSYMDCGMFLQSIMLAAIGEGLATCPQAALAEYPAIVKRALNIEENTVLLCGLALGYEDSEAPVNLYRTPRVPLGEFVTFFEDRDEDNPG